MGLQDFVERARERVAAHDLDGLASVVAQLREQNPAAADQLARAATEAYLTGADEAIDVAWAGHRCGAWRKAPRVIGGPSHTHVCRLDPDHEGPHRCHSGDAHEW